MPQPTHTDRSVRAPKRRSTGRGFQRALLELARFHTSDLTTALRGVLKTASETIGVARASAWFFSAQRAKLVCREMFETGKGLQNCGIVLEAANYPRYFAALNEQRMLVADDARRDPKTSEFTEGYLKPLGISAMLDVPIWHRGEMVGVVCHEHVGSAREWTNAEQDFAASVAETISRAMEAAERAGVERLKASIIETALDCIVIMDGEGRICEFNPAAEKTFGRPRDAVMGRILAEIIIPERYRAAHTAGFTRFLATGEKRVMGRRVEVSALRADGTEFPCELTITLTRVDGAPMFTAYLRDISTRIEAERRQTAQLAVTRVLAEADTLAEAAPRILQAVCESLDWDMGTIWRAENETLTCVQVWHRVDAAVGPLVDANPEQKFRKGEGLPGRIWSSGEPIWIPDLNRDDNFPRAAAASRAGLRSAFGFPVRLDTRVLGVVEFFSREKREIDSDLLAIFGAMGAQVGLFVERRRAEEELRALNVELEARVAARTRELADAHGRMVSALEREQELGMLKSNFISTVTHEFRTPLGVILSSAEMLQRYFDRLAPAERYEQLETINSAVQRMAGLMEEVLLFHKVEGGVSELNREEHDLAALCKLIANEVASATAHRCQIECKIGALPKSSFDDRLFRHIVVNLLNNAVKYSEPGSTVTLAVKRGAKDVVVTVRDRGIGIPEEDQARLFVPFRRGANVGQRAGTGLGLSIAKRCVDLHGGSLEISSKVGAGTTATLRLPVFAR